MTRRRFLSGVSLAEASYLAACSTVPLKDVLLPGEGDERLLVTSRLDGRFTYLQLEIVTFRDLRAQPRVVMEFLDRACEILDLEQTKLDVTLYRREQDALQRPRHLGCYHGDRRWQELRELAMTGQLARLFATDWRSTHSRQLRFDSDIYLGVHFGFLHERPSGHTRNEPGIVDPREAKILKLTVNTRVWDGAIPDGVQTGIVELAQLGFVAVEGACGYIDLLDTYSIFETPTEHERQVGSAYQGPSRVRLCDEVRGAFWGNLLSTHHIARLGAKVSEIDEKVSYHTKELEGGALYLQLTPSLDTTSSEGRDRLALYLDPIMVSPRDAEGGKILEVRVVEAVDGLEKLKADLVKEGAAVRSLPCGEVLVTYPSHLRRPRLDIRDTERGRVIGYRSIPRLLSRETSDDVIVFMFESLVTPRPQSGPIYPPILIEPCLFDTCVKITVICASPLLQAEREQLAELVDMWQGLVYETTSGRSAIKWGLPFKESEAGGVIHVDLAPVGQDAYLQLVLLLDDFSRRIVRLRELHVWPADDCESCLNTDNSR